VRILLDHCTPKPFGNLLTGHEVKTTFKMGWAGLFNGALLSAAAESFDAFVTVDQNIRFQQNLRSLPLPVVVLIVPNNQLPTVAPLAPRVLKLLAGALERKLYLVHATGQVEEVDGPENPDSH
jgi:hypothetical protein